MSQWPVERLDPSGVFETIRVEHGRSLFLKEHIQRLIQSAKTVGITDVDTAQLKQTLRSFARKLDDGYIRVALFRGPKPNWIIHPHRGIPYTSSVLRRGGSVATVPTRWPMAEPGVTQAKLSERLGSILARLDNREAFEVLRLGPMGYLTEGTVSNLFMVRCGRLCTPPTWLGVLEGITRTRVIQVAHRLGIPVEEVPFGRHDLFNAQEAFLTNVLMGILPIGNVDGRPIGRQVPGPVTRRLMRGLGIEGDRLVKAEKGVKG